jgi:hypothetical protein
MNHLSTDNDLKKIVEAVVLKSKMFPVGLEAISKTVARQEGSKRLTQIKGILDQLCTDNIVKPFSKVPKDEFFHRKNIKINLNRVLTVVSGFHRDQPEEPGIARSVIRKNLSNRKDKHSKRIIDERILDYLLNTLVESGTLIYEDNLYRKSDFIVQRSVAAKLDDQEQEIRGMLAAMLKRRNFQTTKARFLEEHLNLPKRKVIASVAELVNRGEFIFPGQDRYVERSIYEEIREKILDLLSQSESVHIRDICDHLNMSRQQIAGIMDYLDQIGDTELIGDQRRLCVDKRHSLTGRT